MGDPPKGWHSRGYLPHLNGGGIAQTVVFRLADSLPAAVLERWRLELRRMPADEAKAEEMERVEAYLDAGRGECWLGRAPIAALVEQALLHFDGARYTLEAWLVMPNHVHALLTPLRPHDLSGIVHSWKSYTANKANRILGRSGRFWHEDYFDRFVRDREHYVAAAQYIENNPVRAGLCQRPEDWPWGSATRRE